MFKDSITPYPNVNELSEMRPFHRNNRSSTQSRSDRASLLDHEQSKPEFGPSHEKTQQQGPAPKTTCRKTLFIVFFSYLAAWSLAISHYIFFRSIDGQEVSNIFALRQSHISTISLLLVTAFRAAIVAVLGTCFTQYLWYLLRERCLQISMIDDLFQIRTNLLSLANLRVFRKAPILFLAATLSWLVPLATVYPPGALTIQSEMQTFFTNVNASIMNPKSESTANPTVSLANIKGGEYSRGEGSPDLRGYIAWWDTGPTAALRSITKYVMSTGQIVPIAPLASENSSYTLTFEGPRVVCRNLTMTNITIPSLPHGISVNAFNATPPEYTLPGENMDFMYFTQTKTMGYYPAKRVEDIDLFSNETFTMVFERQTTQCESFTTMYQVNISYVRGIQQTTYSTGMDKRLIYLALDTFRWNKTEHYEVPKETQGYKDWAAEIPEWVYKTNSRAILESVSSAIAYQWVLSVGRSGSEPILGTYRLPNGSAIELASLSDINSRPESTNNYTLLEDSVLNTRRFGQNETYEFDPRMSLDISEASINAFIANVTISALSLNTWYGSINVTNTMFRNVYRFSHPINLLLPYGLCLGLTFIFIGLGLNALRLNGTSASDGGFLQIMMTTTGDTTMNRQAQVASLGGGSRVPQALLDLEVRFGELVSNHESSPSRRFGFGTMEETISKSVEKD